MLFVSDIYTTAPDNFITPLQEKTYHILQELHIPFERVDTDEAITMDDCVQRPDGYRKHGANRF
jgi:Ala-tRNA(Pro) deacylase